MSKNKNQSAQTRKLANAEGRTAPLRRPRSCSVCKKSITTLGELHMVQVRPGGGKAVMQSRCSNHK